MKSINIIGCGRVGKTLGRAWHSSGVYRVQDVLTRSLASAEQAVA
jgi:predicted dinucleotide-binding enzyme